THETPQAEQRATEAERQVAKLQSEVDRLEEQRALTAEREALQMQKELDEAEDELLSEKERYKGISEELDQTFAELTGY
uniref:Tropomyosin n=1 Tax=Macrostomum lignano TaxID=282301 RepID=A0A1I8JRG5_9PLAT